MKRHRVAAPGWVASGYMPSVMLLVSPAVLFFLWMLSLSLKNEVDNTAYPPVFIPNPPTLANFVDVFAKNDFLSYTINSVIVSFSATGLALLFGVPAGYGIAKAKATKAAALILIARVTPGLSYLIPLFLLFQWLGMIGTLTPLVITHLVITVPIVVWVMIGFFEGLPGELEEAALVDGATIWQAFVHVAMPLARPGIMVAMILSFIFSWNNFIFGVVLAGRTTRTLPVAVYNVLTFEQISWGPLAAAALGGDRAGVAADAVDAEGDRRRPDRRRGERRLSLYLRCTRSISPVHRPRRKRMIRRRHLLAATAVCPRRARHRGARQRAVRIRLEAVQGPVHRGELSALTARRPGAHAPEGVREPHRYDCRLRADPRTAAAPESCDGDGHRASQLRCAQCRHARAEAADRESQVDGGPAAVHRRQEPDQSGFRPGGFQQAVNGGRDG